MKCLCSKLCDLTSGMESLIALQDMVVIKQTLAEFLEMQRLEN